MMVSRRLVAVLVLAGLAPLTLTACGDKDKPTAATPGASGPSKAAQQSGTRTAAGGPALTVTPATGKKDVPVSIEIGVKGDAGKVKSVALRDGKGAAVTGAMRDDGSAWVPGKPLKNASPYVATVVAQDAAGQVKTVTTSFTTMKKAGRQTGTGLYLFDDHTYGVAMPVVAEFSPSIRKKDRAAVQERMFVKTDPPQPGTWSWTSSGTQAYYRAPVYWKPGTKLTVRLALGGLPTGSG